MKMFKTYPVRDKMLVENDMKAKGGVPSGTQQHDTCVSRPYGTPDFAGDTSFTNILSLSGRSATFIS